MWGIVKQVFHLEIRLRKPGINSTSFPQNLATETIRGVVDVRYDASKIIL